MKTDHIPSRSIILRFLFNLTRTIYSPAWRYFFALWTLFLGWQTLGTYLLVRYVFEDIDNLVARAALSASLPLILLGFAMLGAYVILKRRLCVNITEEKVVFYDSRNKMDLVSLLRDSSLKFLEVTRYHGGKKWITLFAERSGERYRLYFGPSGSERLDSILKKIGSDIQSIGWDIVYKKLNFLIWRTTFAIITLATAAALVVIF